MRIAAHNSHVRFTAASLPDLGADAVFAFKEPVKAIQLANGKGAALVDDEDYARLSAYRWQLHADGYAQTSEYSELHGRSRTLLMHRLITGASRGVQVDHVNGDRLLNTRTNLRVCSSFQNNANRRRIRSGAKGVARVGPRWRAMIRLAGRGRHLGCFGTESEAAAAYDAAARLHFGEFAWTNADELATLSLPDSTGSC